MNLSLKLNGNDGSTAPNERVSQPRSLSSRVNDSPSAPETEETTPNHFEGETGINTQSGYVRELLVQVVGETPSVGQNAEVKAALTALEELVAPHNKNEDAATPASQPLINPSFASVDTSKLPLPPWHVVKVAVDKAMSW